MSKKTKQLIIDSLKRALRTFLQTVVAMSVTDGVVNTQYVMSHLRYILLASVIAAFVSFAMGIIGGLPETDSKSEENIGSIVIDKTEPGSPQIYLQANESLFKATSNAEVRCNINVIETDKIKVK